MASKHCCCDSRFLTGNGFNLTGNIQYHSGQNRLHFPLMIEVDNVPAVLAWQLDQTLDNQVDHRLCEDLFGRNGCRCTGEVSLDTTVKGSGYIAHPAIIDNCMQLGPITAINDAQGIDEVTRIVAGLSAFHVRWPALPIQSNCTTVRIRAVNAWEICIWIAEPHKQSDLTPILVVSQSMVCAMQSLPKKGLSLGHSRKIKSRG